MRNLIFLTFLCVIVSCSKSDQATDITEIPNLGKRLTLSDLSNGVSLDGYVGSPDVELKTKWYLGKKYYNSSGKKSCKSSFNICKLKEASLKLKLKSSFDNREAIEGLNEGIETVCEIYENFFLIKMPFAPNEFKIQSFVDNEVLYNSNNYRLEDMDFKSITLNKGDYRVYKKDNQHLILVRYTVNY